MTGAIRYTCRTPNCDGTCSFSSDTFLPNGREWTCPACEDALERQMADDLYQRELARKLVALAEDKERENRFDEQRRTNVDNSKRAETITLATTSPFTAQEPRHEKH